MECETATPGGSSPRADQANSVLVVEDPLICRLVMGILSRAGFRVTEAEPSLGVEYLRSRPGACSLLITNSPKAFLEFAQTIPLIYMAASPDPEVALQFSNCATLRKPFRPNRLVELVRQLTAAL